MIKKVFLIDDDSDIRDVLIAGLEGKGVRSPNLFPAK